MRPTFRNTISGYDNVITIRQKGLRYFIVDLSILITLYKGRNFYLLQSHKNQIDMIWCRYLEKNEIKYDLCNAIFFLKSTLSFIFQPWLIHSSSCPQSISVHHLQRIHIQCSESCSRPLNIIQVLPFNFNPHASLIKIIFVLKS